MKNKIICVWIGYQKTEDKLYEKYLSVNYTDDENPQSQFAKDAELNYYDEDFCESWWFEHMDIEHLNDYKKGLLDYTYFFDELIIELKKRDLSKMNFITFLIGEKNENPINENLFNYQGMIFKDKPIEFVFSKEYVGQ